MECNHDWENNRGNLDKPCIYCKGYPDLKTRYQCKKCMIQACKFCLVDRGIGLIEKPDNIPKRRNEILELRIIKIENMIDDTKEESIKLKETIKNILTLIRNE